MQTLKLLIKGLAYVVFIPEVDGNRVRIGILTVVKGFHEAIDKDVLSFHVEGVVAMKCKIISPVFGSQFDTTGMVLC